MKEQKSAVGPLRVVLCCLVLALAGSGAVAFGRAASGTEEALRSHGVAAPVSISRGSFVVRTDGDREKLLVNLLDNTGGYGILIIDPENGESDFFPYPFKVRTGPFHSLYSRSGLFYGLFGGHFFEFDPRRGEFTFVSKVADDLAMSMTEDDKGVVWAGVYPKAHLFSFDPHSRRLQDHGPMNREDWPQYPRLMAADASGWIYAFIGFTRHQFIAFNPETGEMRALIDDGERVGGSASVDRRAETHTITDNGTLWRGRDGNVYARSPGKGQRDWYRLRDGRLERFGENPAVERKPEFSHSQFAAFHDFSDGRRVESLDMNARELAVIGPDSRMRRVSFDYPSDGAFIYSLSLGPDKRIYGSTGHPLNLFSYDPATGSLVHSKKSQGGHINALAHLGGKMYGAIYTRGVLVCYDPAAESDGNRELELVRLTSAGGDVLRPFELRAHTDGEHLLMTGSPAYGQTGGGMLIYNVGTGKRELLTHKQLLEHHSTKALAILPDGNVIGGTTVEAGTGGRATAETAELYIMDWKTRKIIFRKPILPGHVQIRELMPVGDDLVIALAGEGQVEKGVLHYAQGLTFFVFNWKTRQLLSTEALVPLYGRFTGGQAARVWHQGEDGMIYCLFERALVQIDPDTLKHTKIADLPLSVAIGVAVADGRIYFSSGSRLYSYPLPYAAER